MFIEHLYFSGIKLFIFIVYNHYNNYRWYVFLVVIYR